jgi:transcriptional regulator with XRE-family HTH domain
MKERILEFLKAENKTSAQFAEEIGVQPSGISHILSGRNKPSLDFVLKMLEKYRFISTDWLLFGKGNMYKETVMQSLFEESADKPEISREIIRNENQNDIQSGKYSANTRKSEVISPKNELTVEKIVWFYENNSFREYFPESE